MKSPTRYIAPWRRENATTDKKNRKNLAAMRGEPAIYHCVSRVVDRRRAFGAEEKEHLVRLMREYEQFCDVRILAYCVLSDHFHVLIEIPERSAHPSKWTDKEFSKHLASLYSGDQIKGYELELAELRKAGDNKGAEEYRERFISRMWDISSFMHDLKMRFTHWFNTRNDRDGCLWTNRFESVLVQSGHATRLVAAYIDLNPVRAELVDDPKDYRWCSYGDAMAGSKKAREGLNAAIFGHAEQMDPHSWKDARLAYQAILFPDESKSNDKDGRMSETEMIRHRVRYFVEGKVIGSEEFVEKSFELSREFFGATRKTGAREIPEVNTNLRSIQTIRKDPIDP